MSLVDRPTADPGIVNPELRHQHDEYPVHLSGLIQPHGVLIAVNPTDWTVTRVSQNITAQFGKSLENVLGKPLNHILPTEQITQLQAQLQSQADGVTHSQLSLNTASSVINLNCFIHQTQTEIVVELEPIAEMGTVQLMAERNRLHQAINRLQQIADLDQFLQTAVGEISRMTDFDHIMVYKFDAQQAGQVIAEVAQPGIATYLGQHFPAPDIPSLVRRLYQTGIYRFAPDLNAVSVPIIDLDRADGTPPLDLSRAILRNVDPCCVTYHQNMAVNAFLIIALIKDQELWGLISCHNTTPRSLSHSARSDCQLLGQFISAELANKVSQEELEHVIKLGNILSEFVASIAQAENFKQALLQPQNRLLDLVGAQGAAVCLDGEVTLVGETPPLNQVEALIEWSDSHIKTNLFHTHQLDQAYPAAAAYPAVASGLMLLKISQIRQYYILWFRPEVPQTITWAGNPTDHLSVNADGEISMCPRASFEAWQSNVKATALPWQQAELDNAIDLRNAIIGIVLNKADELAQINLDLERSNHELASFAYAASHDLKEPLRGIHNFSNLLLKRYSEVLDESGIKRLQTLVRLTQRMDMLIDSLLKLSRLGQTELTMEPTDLQAIVERVIEVLQASRSDATAQANIQIARALPTIDCDPILMGEVFTNLLSNALKYTKQAHPIIEIGYLTPEEQSEIAIPADVASTKKAVIFYIRDNGIGIRDRHHQNIFQLFKRLHERDAYGGGAGAGLTITKKIIERHQGKIWVNSVYGEGTEFCFMLT
ncbi:GAF domain-containing protein [filamentous cyanobacterium LEGE 11480]|uniref:histidine kinase n=1 Tax=Romeriopsis navalis LEGE 11480 TaxID=2777977 RepID=A0A928VTF5_9CYAN|nr:ATP-binding protein [Romeriopsis navalis]MBE9031764.1 GAF domain-containing protein [Romeriopsis navalis LEGE 11480]